jgi:hypothetical protein
MDFIGLRERKHRYLRTVDLTRTRLMLQLAEDLAHVTPAVHVGAGKQSAAGIEWKRVTDHHLPAAAKLEACARLDKAVALQVIYEAAL